MTRRSNSGEAPARLPGSAATSARSGSRRPSRAAEDEGRAALMPYMMAGFPDRETVAGGRRGLCRRRRRPDRARGALLRSARRRADDPRRGDRRRWTAGATLATALEVCAVGLRAGAGRADGLREHGPRPRRRRRSSPRRRGRRRRRRGDRPRPAARTRRRRCARRFAAAGLALVPLVAPTTPAERRRADLRRGPRLRLRRLDRRHHRRARRAAAGAGRAGRRDQGRGARCRSRSASGSAPPSRPRRSGEIADGVIIGSRLVRAAGEARLAAGAPPTPSPPSSRDARRPRRIGCRAAWEWSSHSFWRSPR